MKNKKIVLSIFLMSIILFLSFSTVTNAATTSSTKTNAKAINLVFAFDNKKGNYEIAKKPISIAIDGKTVYSEIISTTSKSDKLKTAAIKDISIKKLNIDVSKNRSVPIKISVGNKVYYTYINTFSFKKSHLSTLRVKAQYTNSKIPSLKGFTNYKWL